jgi:hypothetical protein
MSLAIHARFPPGQLVRYDASLPLMCSYSYSIRLKTKDGIRILWRESADSELLVFYDSFPRDVATAFSESFNEAFPPLSKTPLGDPLKPQPKTFVIVGGRRESYREILEWMLSCCTGSGVRTFPFIGIQPFYNYSMAYLAACALGVKFLESQLMERLENIARRQVHSLDAELIFSMIQGPSELKDTVCKSIGTAIWEQRLKARYLYEELRRTEGLEEFNQGIIDVIEGLKMAKKSSPEYMAMIAAKKKEAQRMNWRLEEQAKRKTAQFIANKHKIPASAVTIRGDQGYTISTEGRFVNRGRNGRATRIAVPLANLDITRESFSEAQPKYRQSNTPAPGVRSASKHRPNKPATSQGKPPSQANDSEADSAAASFDLAGGNDQRQTQS